VVATAGFAWSRRGLRAGGRAEAGAVYIRLLIVSRDANGAHVDAD
jgi:hypothetical protein